MIDIGWYYSVYQTSQTSTLHQLHHNMDSSVKCMAPKLFRSDLEDLGNLGNQNQLPVDVTPFAYPNMDKGSTFHSELY